MKPLGTGQAVGTREGIRASPPATRCLEPETVVPVSASPVTSSPRPAFGESFVLMSLRGWKILFSGGYELLRGPRVGPRRLGASGALALLAQAARAA